MEDNLMPQDCYYRNVPCLHRGEVLKSGICRDCKLFQDYVPVHKSKFNSLVEAIRKENLAHAYYLLLEIEGDMNGGSRT